MITLGIPTYNRAEILKKTLLSLQTLKSPSQGFEIIVIDNNSSDHTRQVCEKYLPSNGRYIPEGKQGVSHARNRVFEEARGELIAFTDDDGSPAEDWLLELEKVALAHPDSGLFMGRTENEWEVNPPHWYKPDSMHKIVFNYSCDMGHAVVEIPLDCYPAGPNMAFRHWVYDKIGGFNPRFGILGGKKIGGEEIDFAWRAKRHGIKGHYTPYALVHHRVHENLIRLRSLFKGAWADGLSSSILVRLYPQQYSLECGKSFFNMPLWWWRTLAISPFRNSCHIVYHFVIGDLTASIHHLLGLVRWAGRIRYLFLWSKDVDKFSAE